MVVENKCRSREWFLLRSRLVRPIRGSSLLATAGRGVGAPARRGLPHSLFGRPTRFCALEMPVLAGASEFERARRATCGACGQERSAAGYYLMCRRVLDASSERRGVTDARHRRVESASRARVGDPRRREERACFGVSASPRVRKRTGERAKRASAPRGRSSRRGVESNAARGLFSNGRA